jgi:hypothetical protein
LGLATDPLPPVETALDTLMVAGGHGVQAAAMRRGFRRLLAATPQDYRARFSS